MRTPAVHTRTGGRRFPRLLLLSILLPLLAGGAAAIAQGPDRKISIDPWQMVLGDDARIESAAAIGSRTLVVWGSSRAGVDRQAHNVLYMQMFEGRIPLGEPHLLTSFDAEPSGHLQVI